jgi:antitoxin FitA
MPVTFSVKNVPDDLAQRIRERAKRNRRSLQGELIAILEEAGDARPLSPRDVYERGKALGLSTPSDSTRWIREDRDAR